MRCSAASTAARKIGATASTAAPCTDSKGPLRASATAGVASLGRRPAAALWTSWSAEQSAMLRVWAAVACAPSCLSSGPVAAMCPARSASSARPSPTRAPTSAARASLAAAAFSSSCRRPTSRCTSAADGTPRPAVP
eukprot:scaffold235739_cov44-Prasinocladus_malaysianus.AAC.3